MLDIFPNVASLNKQKETAKMVSETIPRKTEQHQPAELITPVVALTLLIYKHLLSFQIAPQNLHSKGRRKQAEQTIITAHRVNVP